MVEQPGRVSDLTRKFIQAPVVNPLVWDKHREIVRTDQVEISDGS